MMWLLDATSEVVVRTLETDGEGDEVPVDGEFDVVLHFDIRFRNWSVHSAVGLAKAWLGVDSAPVIG